MSFLKIVDPAKREQTVKEFLAIKKNICANELAEKTGKIELQTDLSELFKPITETQKTTASEITETQKDTKRAITEGLRPIKKGLEPIKGLKGIKTSIEQLPQRLLQQKRPSSVALTILKRPPTSPPPAYMSPEPSTSKADPAEEIRGVQPYSDDVDFGIYEKGGEFFIGNKPIELTESEGKKFLLLVRMVK